MFFTLRQDLQKYCERGGSEQPPSLLRQAVVICSSPGYWAIIHHRFGFWVNGYFGEGYNNPFKVLFKLFYFITKPMIVYLAKIDILVTTDIGPGLFLSNKGNIILGLQRMGKNCIIHHNVTIGQGVEGKTPEFGDNIWVGSGSIVYGNLSLGSNTIIESGTVLAKSLPGSMQIGGNPCRIRKRTIEAGPYPVDREDD